MYTSLAKVDWNTFNYIHSNNAREAFQQLTEQLFCFEFEQPNGVYRYYNQPYIETMPIRVGDEYIGFQSKYFDASTKLSDQVDELKDAIDGAYKKYTGLTQIIFYTNKEPGISTKEGGTKPAYIQTIETYAADRNIRIDWRGLNQIETSLINPANAYLRDYFFATNGGIRKILEQIKSHTINIFNAYVDWLANVLLQLDITLQNNILAGLIPHLTGDDCLNDLLTRLINIQDAMKMVSSFWNIWNQLFTAIEALCNKEKESIISISDANLGHRYGRHSDEVVSTYLLAFPWWQNHVHEWHTLRREDSDFFALAVNKIGYHPAVLYSIARVLNSIGYIYTDLGVKWLSTLIVNNAHLSNCDLPTNTQYYIEEYVRRFCSNNRNKLKTDAEIRNALITVLSFLVDRGSTCGYMLREQYC